MRVLLWAEEGAVTGERLVLMVASLMALGAVGSLGGGMGEAIAGTGRGEPTPTTAAAAAEGPVGHDGQGGQGGSPSSATTTSQSGGGADGGDRPGYPGDGPGYDASNLPSMSTPPGNGGRGGLGGLWDRAVSATEGVRGFAYNATTNLGLNPLAWVGDPVGQMQASWDRTLGVLDFGRGLLEGALELNRLYNPVDPRYGYELITRGPSEFFGERWAVSSGLGSGLLDIGESLYEYTPPGVAQDLLFNRENYFSDRLGALEDLWNNPLVSAVADPFVECGSGGGASNRRACGEAAGDVLLTIATGGVGSGVRGGALADDAVRAAAHGDDLADVAHVADDALDLTAHTDDFADGSRAADDLVEGTAPLGAASRATPAEVRAAWADQIVDEVTMAQLERYGLTPDTPLYRWTHEEYVTDGVIRGNPNSVAQVADVYGPPPSAPEILAARMRGEAAPNGPSHRFFRDLNEDPGLNVSAVRSGEYGSSDRVLVEIRTGDVVSAGGRIYPDVSANVPIDPMMITVPDSLPVRVVPPG
ncbi:MAG: hypothetical protein KC416_03975 [Myxococcales bacterium]|nr:hypothetical protein [Myxococcales bacterium]